jgi:hypothetical protein
LSAGGRSGKVMVEVIELFRICGVQATRCLTT